ncbi:MAG TPA: copper-binding protein [Noviherbaspirillum sp.]|nr:copper-binding protein [Noviherbaspirillum sp.]
MKSATKLTLAIALAMAASSAALAQPSGHDSHHPAPASKKDTAPAQMSDGEVRKVDKDAKKITIKHGELRNLGMPPMTMVFQVQDPAILDQVKAGDKISFTAEQIGGKLTVTKVEPKK